MNIEQIVDEWTIDTQIDQTDLSTESLKIPKLHNKYIKILYNEKLRLRKLDTELKTLKREKYEFYTQGPSKETEEKGWKLPPRGMILKTDIPMYLDSDDDIINLTLKIGYSKEKIELLEEIIKSINNRGFNIKAAIDWHRFTMGN
jgi:hypothetical protein